MRKTGLRPLIAQQKKLTKVLREVNVKIKYITETNQLPELQAKYEGKHFKYRNNYSCPETEADYWFIYYRVVKIIDSRECLAVVFQTEKYGKSEISCKEEYYQNEWIEISKEEYQNALEDFQMKIVRLIYST